MEEEQKIEQVAVSGLVSYEKVIYETYDKLRTFDVHYLGDVHYKKSKCHDEVFNSIQLLETTLLKQIDIPIDVFVEVGLGYVGESDSNYLNSLITTFQTKYSCLLLDKSKCSSSFPNVKFHNIDFRHSLFIEYQTIISGAQLEIKKNGGRVDYRSLQFKIIDFIERVSMGRKHELPYSSVDKNRELLRLFWVYEMIHIRSVLYDDNPHFVSESSTKQLGFFLCDLYSLILLYQKGNETQNALYRFLPTSIKTFYTPYYHFRLSHEYLTIPEITSHATVRYQFEIVISEKIKDIQKTDTFTEFQKKVSTSIPLAIEHAVVETSWFMDMYACFRSMKPYVHHVIFILGVNHITQMKSFMNSLEIVVKESSRFDNANKDKNNPLQCVSVPVTDHGLILDSNLFQGIIPILPDAIVLGSKRKCRTKRTRRRKNKRSFFYYL
jgi:hypothetical protein